MEVFEFEEDYKVKLKRGFTQRSWWLESTSGMKTAWGGKHYLLSWLVRRGTNSVATGKYEVTIAPPVWYKYASVLLLLLLPAIFFCLPAHTRTSEDDNICLTTFYTSACHWGFISSEPP